jgi:hypothetical protein
MADPIAPEVTEWLHRYAASLGVDPPSDAEIDALLRLAAVAARGSARQAAPIACWLAAKAGLEPEQAIAVAQG